MRTDEKELFFFTTFLVCSLLTAGVLNNPLLGCLPVYIYESESRLVYHALVKEFFPFHRAMVIGDSTHDYNQTQHFIISSQ